MTILVFLGIFIGASIFFAPMAYPGQKENAKVILSFNTSRKSLLDIYLLPLAKWVASVFPMGKFQKQSLEKKLKTANLDITPEMYFAQAITLPTVFFLVTLVPLILLMPLLILAVFMMCIVLFRKQMGYVDTLIKETREIIEKDMPHFVIVISQFIMRSRDIIKLLESFKEVCSDAFKREIDITLADMKTGSIDNALWRMETRTSNPMLSQVLRGLLGVSRGENQIMYFEILQTDFSKLEKERMRQRAKDKPLELKPYTLSMLILFVVAIVTGLLFQISSSVQVLF